MKRYTLLFLCIGLLSMLGSVLPANAQQKNDNNALYIFRNDGGFDAFFFADIQNIGYSCVDTLGVVHEDFVVQEIQALDTLFRIPISAIDSVAFITPKTVYKADVVRPDQTLTDYIVASDSVSWFRLSPSVPVSVVPQVGDKVLIEDPVPFLPDGLSGKVTNVISSDEGYTVETEAVALEDLYDRLILKGSGSAPSSAIEAKRRIGGELLDTQYIMDEPIELPSLSGTLSPGMTGDLVSAFNDNFKITLDGVISATCTVSPKLTYFRGFLYYDVGQGVKYQQYIRIDTKKEVKFGLSGSLTGTLDIPFTFAKDLVKGALKNGGKTLVKRIGDFNVDLGFGWFFSLSGVYKCALTHEENSYSVSQLLYEAPVYHVPNERDFVSHSSTKKLNDKFSVEGWAGGATFSTGLFAKADAKVPVLKRTWEVGARIEIGGKFEETVPINIANELGALPVMETGQIYRLINREYTGSLSLYAGIQLEAKFGNWKPISFNPEVSYGFDANYSVLPDMSSIKWVPYAKAPWRGSLITPVDGELFISKPVGFAIFDITDEEHPEQITDYWKTVKYSSQRIYSILRQEFTDLEPSKFYKAYPQTQVFGYPLLADQEIGFTLGPPSMKFTPKHVEVEANSCAKEIEVITNIKDTEFTTEDDWLNNIKPIWYKEEGRLSIYPDELPEGINRRVGHVIGVGKDKDGKEILRDTITVVQLRPYVKAVPQTVEFGINGGTQKVTIEHSLDKVDASIAQGMNSDKFFTMTQDDDNTLTITAPENTTGQDLSGTVIINTSSSGGMKTEPYYLHVLQAGVVSPLEVPYSVQIPYHSELLLSPRSYTTRLESLINFDFETVDAKESYTNGPNGEDKWYSISPKFYKYPDADGIYTTLWNISVEANPWDYDRDATIRLIFWDATKEHSAETTITILQKSASNLFTVKPETTNLHSDGGYNNRKYLSLELALPGSADAKSNDDWLKVDNSTDTELVVYADKNPSGKPRTGSITISVYDGAGDYIGGGDYTVTQSIVDMENIELIDEIYVSMEAITNKEDFDKNHVTYNIPNRAQFDFKFDEIKCTKQGSSIHVEATTTNLWSNHYGYYELYNPYLYRRGVNAWPLALEAKVSFDMTDILLDVNNVAPSRINNVKLTVDCIDDTSEQPRHVVAAASGLAIPASQQENEPPTWENGHGFTWAGTTSSWKETYTDYLLEKFTITNGIVTYEWDEWIPKEYTDVLSKGGDVSVEVRRAPKMSTSSNSKARASQKPAKTITIETEIIKTDILDTEE